MMNKFISSVTNFISEEEGASAVEYGVLVALIVVAVIAVVQLIGAQLSTAFQSVQTCLATPAACTPAAPPPTP